MPGDRLEIAVVCFQKLDQEVFYLDVVMRAGKAKTGSTFQNCTSRVVELCEQRPEGDDHRRTRHTGYTAWIEHRISITVNRETDNAGKELPFVIGVLADFSGMPESPLKPLRYRRFVDVLLDNLDAVLEACAPRLLFEVSNRLTEEHGPPLRVTLKFSSVKNFEPGALVHQIPPLRALLELRGKLADLRASLQNKELDEKLQEVLNNPEKLNKLKKEVEPAPASPEPPAPTPPPPPITAPRRRWREAQERPEEPGVWSRANVAVEPSILDELVEVRPAAAEDKERTRSSLKEFVGQVLQGEMAVGRDAEAMINARIAQIDHLMSLQLREVQHEESFQRLEATWRGLHFLLRQNRKFKNVKVRLLNITKKELLQQFERERVRFESAIARKVLHEAAETPGAEPFSLLIGDYQIERYPADTSLEERLARLGA